MVTKICTKCGIEFPATLEYFHANKNSKTGMNSRCKRCQNLANKICRDKNPNYIKEYAKKNKEKIKNSQKQYYENNKDKISLRNKEYWKQYYKDNKNKIHDYKKQWTTDHPDYFKQHYLANKTIKQAKYLLDRDRILSVKKVWRNREDVKAREKENQKNRYKNNICRDIRLVCNQKYRSKAKNNCLNVDDWIKVKKLFNNQCAYCGSDVKLTQDHVKPLSKGGTYSKNNIIPACGKCNSSKNNKDIEKWYKSQPFFKEERLQTINKYLENI